MSSGRHRAECFQNLVCSGPPGDIPDPWLCSATTSRSQAPFFRSHSLTVPSSELDRTRPLQNCRHVTADWCLLGPEGNITRVFETTGGVTTSCDVTTLPHLAACADTVRSGCPTLGPLSRRSRTRGCRHAAPCRWLVIGGPSAYGHTHLDRTHPNSAQTNMIGRLYILYMMFHGSPVSTSQTLMDVSNEPLTTNTPSNWETKSTEPQ